MCKGTYKTTIAPIKVHIPKVSRLDRNDKAADEYVGRGIVTSYNRPLR